MKFIKAEDIMMDGIMVMLVLMASMLLFVSFITKKDVSKVVDDPCKTTSSINNCIVIGADKIRMLEEYNRVVRLNPMTYFDALVLCYKLLQEKAEELDKLDTHSQGLSNDYKMAQLLLNQLYLYEPKDITHNKYEK